MTKLNMFGQRICIYYCCSPGSPSFTLTLIDLNSFSLKEQEELDERPEIWGSEGEPEDDFDDESEGENVDTGFAIKSLTAFIHLLFVWQMAFVVSDNCLKILLAIIGYLLTTLQIAIGGNHLQAILDTFPATLHKARKFVGFDKDEFVKFIVCPKCKKLYPYNEGYIVKQGRKESKTCDFVAYPQHPQQKYRAACGEPLMKSVISANGKKSSLYPHRVFCYQSVKVSLQRLLNRKDILQELKHGVQKHQGTYFDIYDGEIWSRFKDFCGNNYFENKRHLAGMLNIDWFQPFDGSEHSIGAIYMVLLNLPREMRFKKENVILVGIIPGPKEPELNVNSFLRPLVNELLRPRLHERKLDRSS